MNRNFSFENIIKGKLSCGLEIVLQADGLFEFNLVILKKEKSLISVQNKVTGIKNIEEVSKIIGPKTPVVLVFNGKGIVHRKVSISENDSSKSLLNKALPNAKADDFYFQKTEIDTTHAFVSIIRASLIDDIISRLKENKITNIVSCLLGPFIIQQIISLLDHSLIINEKFSFEGFELLIREDKIADITFTSHKSHSFLLSLEEDKIESTLIISFSSALSYFTGTFEGIENSPIINFIKEEFKQKRKFEFAGLTLLVFSLIILLINYFVFNFYWEKGNKLSSELSLNQSAINRYDTLKKEYHLKKTFLDENGLLENSQTSLYADRLAVDLPPSIQMLDLNIHPIKKKEIKDEESTGIFFQNKKISISGKCKKNVELNEWMKIMKKKDWIADVTLINYKQDNALEAGLFFIEIKIK